MFPLSRVEGKLALLILSINSPGNIVKIKLKLLLNYYWIIEDVGHNYCL